MQATVVGFSGDRKKGVVSPITGAGVGTCVVWRQKIWGFLFGGFCFLNEIGVEFSPESEGSRSLKRGAQIGNGYDGEWETV